MTQADTYEFLLPVWYTEMYTYSLLIFLWDLIIIKTNNYFFCSQIFPVFYVLTTHRTNECYSAVLKYIEEYIFKLEPDEIITDFEAGLRLPIRKYFPQTVLRGCWYHYCVKPRERFGKRSLNSLIKNNVNAMLIKQELMSLPLLPPEKFTEGYDHIKQLVQGCRLSEQFKSFFEYYDYWIQEVIFIIITITPIGIRVSADTDSFTLQCNWNLYVTYLSL